MSDTEMMPHNTGARYDPLLQPLAIKHLTIRNRIMGTSHAAGIGEDGGMPSDRYQRYHLEKARGGIGLTMFGGSSNISIDSPSIMPQLNVGVDRVIPYLQEFSEKIHAEGAALMCQITHLGRRGEADKGALLPTVAPSVVRETLHRSIPKEMDQFDINRIVSDYAAAALRCKEGGIDGVECLSAAHLIGQFLSPTQNFRTDKYGGSLENRCRFAFEVFSAIRAAVGDKFILGLRFVVDEGYEEGLSFPESLAIAKLLQSEGHIDYFNAVFGSWANYASLVRDCMPGMDSPSAPFLAQAAAFKEEITLPVFHATKIADVATARYAIKEGLIDMVGMTRAHIADPYIVQKIAAGEEHRIRPCVGATHCMTHMRPTCLHNPATGHEAVLHHVIVPAERKRKVVVVGAGPAGLEAARVSAERGHDVSLFEAAPLPGGQVILAAKTSWRSDLSAIIDWRMGECERLGVKTYFNHFADSQSICAESPDLVVIATGGVPNHDVTEGGELLTSAWDILAGNAQPASEVVVADGTGRNVALSAADICHRQGASVQFLTIDDVIAAEQPYGERVTWRKWARATLLPVRTEEKLIKVRRDNNKLVATFRSELTDEVTEISTAQIIYDYGTTPIDDLYHALRRDSRNNGVTDLEQWAAGKFDSEIGGGFALHRIGDAVSSRNIHAAINDALRLCQNC